jgi:hypothetical protein
MISKCILFLAAGLLLANCSAIGSARGPVAATGSLPAWDGLGSTPDDDDTQAVEPAPRKTARAKKQVSAAQKDIRPGDTWQEQQAADLEDEKRLRRKLMICTNCAVESAREDTGAVRR